jgi:TRAP-type mannitol/chloroaromatic compound transport system substrate-binding protein
MADKLTPKYNLLQEILRNAGGFPNRLDTIYDLIFKIADALEQTLGGSIRILICFENRPNPGATVDRYDSQYSFFCHRARSRQESSTTRHRI